MSDSQPILTLNIASGVYPDLQSPDGATEPWSIFWGEGTKNIRIRTQLKHILSVITLKYNSKYLIIQKITNKFPSSVFNHRLNTKYTKYMS